MNHLATISEIYAAFGRSDIPTILSHLADDIDWEYSTFPNPVPWLQPLQGRDQVPQFFDALLSRVEFTQFEPRGFFTNDSNTVVDLIDVKFIVRATGKEVIEPDSVHIWHFNDQGKVQRFKHRVDTWQSAMALRADQ